jgi:4-carboxymuconolactone decarboxylase
MSDELYQKGARMMSDVYCDIVAVAEQGDSRFGDLMIPNIFGQLWDESKLPIKERRLFTMGIIAAMGEYGVFEIQAAAALKRKELTVEQLHELCCQAAPYAGYPRSGGLLAAVRRAIAVAEGDQ